MKRTTTDTTTTTTTTFCTTPKKKARVLEEYHAWQQQPQPQQQQQEEQQYEEEDIEVQQQQEQKNDESTLTQDEDPVDPQNDEPIDEVGEASHADSSDESSTTYESSSSSTSHDDNSDSEDSVEKITEWSTRHKELIEDRFFANGKPFNYEPAQDGFCVDLDNAPDHDRVIRHQQTNAICAPYARHISLYKNGTRVKKHTASWGNNALLCGREFVVDNKFFDHAGNVFVVIVSSTHAPRVTCALDTHLMEGWTDATTRRLAHKMRPK